MNATLVHTPAVFLVVSALLVGPASDLSASGPGAGGIDGPCRKRLPHVRIGQRVGPDHAQILSGPVAARFFGHAGRGGPKTHTPDGFDPLGPTTFGRPRPSNRHFAGDEVDLPRSSGEFRQPFAVSTTERITIVLSSPSITNRSSAMSFTMVDHDGPPSPARAINGLKEVVQAVRAEFRAIRRPGLSHTKIRQGMADVLKDPDKLGYLDDSSRDLAGQVTELLLVSSQLATVAENGRNQARTAHERAISEFNKAQRTASPSRSRQHLDAAGEHLVLSKKLGALADQALSLFLKLDKLTEPWGSRCVSLPLPPRYKAALATAPSTDSFRVALAYAKGQLAMWRALEPDLMRSLTVCRDRAAKPSQTPESNRRTQAKISPIPSRRAISTRVGVPTAVSDVILDPVTPATDPDPQPDPSDAQPGIDHSVGETNGTLPGNPDTRPVVIIGPGPADDGDGDGASAPPLVTDGR